MSNALKTLFQDIADAIHAKTGDNTLMKPAEFPEKISAIGTGTQDTILTDVPISLDFSAGDNQTVAADDGTLIKSAVIAKPETLSPENIAEGIDIAGVVGTLASGESRVILNDDDWINDVVFWDIDGTIVHKVTVADAANLTSLPTPPERDKLTFVGWNYTIEQIRTLNRPLDVGAMYATTDGNTYLKLSITDAKYLSVPIEFIQTVANGVTVDWGDGSTTTSGTTVGSYTTLSHTYSSTGTYWVSITVAEECVMTAGRGTSGYAFVGGHSNYYRKYPTEIYFGERVILNSYCMDWNVYVEKVVFPPEITEIPMYCMQQTGISCIAGTCIVIPDTVTIIGSSAFNNCCGSYYYYTTYAISIPESVTSFAAGAIIRGEFRLKRLIIPTGITELSTYFAYQCYDLKKVYLPYSLTYLAKYAFNACPSLREVVISANASKADYTVFSECPGISKVVIKNDDAVTTLDLLCEDVVIQPSMIQPINIFYNSALWKRMIVTGNPDIAPGRPKTCLETVFTGEPSVSVVTRMLSGNYYSRVYVPDAIFDTCMAAASGDYIMKLKPLSEYSGVLPEI